MGGPQENTHVRDLAHSIKPVLAFAPAAKAATANGLDVDLSGYEAAVFHLVVGTVTDGTHTPKLQEADDNGSGAPGTYADVAAASQIGSFTALTTGAGNGGSAVQEVGYIGAKRWVRLVMTVSGATTGAVYGAEVVLGRARSEPA